MQGSKIKKPSILEGHLIMTFSPSVAL